MTDKTIDAAILLPCPFCGGPGHEAMTCGKAIPDCESCAAVFGCNRCDVWCDTAEAWNTRTTDLARLLEAMRRDTLEAESISLLDVRVRHDGSGFLVLDNGDRATFDTIDAGVAQLRAIIDDAEDK